MQLSTIFALLPAITMVLAAPTETHGRERRTDIVRLSSANVKELLEKAVETRDVGTHRRKPRLVLPEFTDEAKEKLKRLGLSEEDLKDLEEDLAGGITIKKRDIS